MIGMATRMKISIEITNDNGDCVRSTRTDEIPSFEDFETKGFRDSFDKIENAVLESRKEVSDSIVEAYLSGVSKKKVQLLTETTPGKAEESPFPYGIESEMGTLEVQTHRIVDDLGKITYNVNTECFAEVHPKEKHRSSRFNELMYEFSSELSYRDCGRYLNRIRQQSDGIKVTTLRNTVERDGIKLQNHIQNTLGQVLISNGFSETGVKGEEVPVPKIKMKSHDEAEVLAVAQELGITHQIAVSDYENPAMSIDIAIDDVGVKRQSDNRPNPDIEESSKKRKYAYQTVVHISNQSGSFVLNAANQMSATVLTLGFLLHNCLLWGHQLLFYVDGETSLFTTIKKVFGFLPIKFILDWYHVDKKLKERLSMGMNGYKLRNAFLEKLRPLLWKGDVDGAIALLKNLPDNHIKNIEHITKLIDYLTRNKNYIPCYAIRAKLGLCNSSNKGEKANDLVVSNRQKHNGMSWSREGSLGLASICAISHNRQLENWAYNHTVDLSLREVDSSLAA